MQRTMGMWMITIALAGCAEGVGGRDGSAGYQHEVRGGNLHHDAIAGATMTAVELDTVLDAGALAGAVGPLGAADFTTRTTTRRGPGGRALTHVHAQQTVDGVPIAGAFLHLTLAPAEAGRGAHLLGSSYHLFHGTDVDTTPVIDAAAAEAAAGFALRAPDGTPVWQRRLVIHELDGELALVWEVSLRDHHHRALVRATGELAGRVERIDDRVFDSRGTVRAWIAGGAPGGPGTPRQVALAEARVWAGGAATLTGDDGSYSLAAAPGSTIAAGLVGRAAEVINRGGTAAIATAPVAARVDLAIGSSSAGEQVLAQTTAFHAVTAAHRFLIDNGFEPGALGAPLETRVNVPDTCNAYYAPSARTLNLFRRGGGCNNSAEASIVVHEYGHFVDDVFGGLDDGGLSEGWGDALACLVLRAPEVGAGLFQDGTVMRTCDNDYRYPRSGRDEVHDLGQAWSGFVWHLRAGLIDRLGEERGDALTRALVLPSLASGAPDIPSALREVFLRDDDDGDLANGTPHAAELNAAAARHGLEHLVLADEAPPGVVDDLRVIATTATTITLRWSAPGDDGHRGTAARYDLRWSARPITASGFGRAIAADAPAPARAGAPQETTIAVPPMARVYVALRTIDELGNTSKLSNVATAELPAPSIGYHDGAEAGLGRWAATGLWHVTRRDAGAGAQAFWYGREDRGTYDTGGPNAGTLTSPEIDLAGVETPRLAFLERVDVESDPGVDVLTVEVFDVADPARRVTAAKVTGYTRGFVPRVVDLGPLTGRRVRIRFHFDSVDGRLDATAGWFLDEVRVLAAASPPPPDGVLVINEVLADPPSGYDAGGDGTWDARDDELIELVNGSALPIDLGGAVVSDGTAVRATFAAGTVLAPGRALVLFGGPAPPIPGVTTVITQGLSLNNDGDAVFVRRPDGRVLAELRYGGEGGHDQSLTRARDGDPASPMVGHRTLAAAPASPGRHADGRPF